MNESSRKGRASRAKGARGERVARDYHHQLGLAECQRAARNGVDGASDLIDCLPDGCCEVKTYARFAVYGIIEQAAENAKPTEFPYAFLKADRKEPLFVCYFSDLPRVAASVARITGTPIHPDHTEESA